MMKVIRKDSELDEARSILLQMQKDSSLTTLTAYRANSEMWPGNKISFVDAHLSYLKAYPQVKVSDYISNLRLKLRKSPSRS